MKKMQLCSLIEAARKEKGLSREALAEKVGVSTTTVLRWEKDLNRPFFSEVVLLSEILNKSLDYFAGKDTTPKEEDIESDFDKITSLGPEELRRLRATLDVLFKKGKKTSKKATREAL